MPKRRILVVDDNRDAAESMGLLLEFLGHRVHIAFDGLSAFDLAVKHRPDIVFLDINMPIRNGWEVCRGLRTLPWGPEILVVAVTAYDYEDVEVKAREAGFDLLLVKPVELERIEALLRDGAVGQ